MIEGKKISELIPANVINDACCFPVLSKGATRKITFAVLLENIISNLQLPETQEIKQLKSEVEKMNTSIELTDKQVESVVLQMNDLQKDVDGQDAVIIKYTKLIEELKEIYEQASITGGVVDSSLNSESINPVQNRVITKLIPAQANEENKLADKDFVNSSIATNTAEFIGTFNSLEELQNTDKSFDNNDYGFVIETDENGNSSYNRYKYNGSEWVFEYTLNNSSFTSEQWSAIQSGITAELVALIGQATGSSPIGTILAFSGENVPAGFLLCDGRELLIENYQKLYDVIGHLSACQSENEGYFKLPDLTRRFLEGGPNIGEYKEAGLPNITGSFTDHNMVTTFKDIEGAFEGEENVYYDANGQSSPTANPRVLKLDASKGETKTDGTLKTEDEHHVYGSSDTVQPASYTVNYIIKATSTNDSLDETIDDSTCDIGHTWSSEKIFNMIKGFCTPRLIDFNTYTETAASASSGADNDFTADEDCFVAISQQWSNTDLSAWCHLFDKDDNLLAYDGFSGYGLSNAPSVVAGFIFVPKGETIKYRFTQGSGNLQNPKIIVRTR